jgi:GNAT superfamily N-acetyltransferase
VTDYVDLQVEDMVRITEFCNRNFDFHQGQFAAEPLRRTIFDDPDYKSEHGFIVLDGEGVVGLMVGVQRKQDAWLKLFAVDKDRRRLGIARQMLDKLEGRFRNAGVQRVHTLNSSPHYVMPGLDVRYTAGVCLLQGRGYQLDQYVHNMRIDLDSVDFDTDEAELDLAEDGIVFRRLRYEDETVLRPWIHGHWGYGWATEACNSLKNDPVTSHLALSGERVVGFATYDVMALTSGFGPTGVDDSMRGQGLGKILLFRCLEDMKRRGDRHCEVTWVGPISYYAHTVSARISSTLMHSTKVL